MVKLLFPNFLNDPNEYRQAEMLWRERWDDLVRRVGQEGQWVTPWFTTTFADGTPFADGNPILSAVAPARRLGVRVIQVEPAEEPPELSSWTDTFAEGQPEAIKELVVACALTPRTLEDGLGIMERWITKEEGGAGEASASDRHATEGFGMTATTESAFVAIAQKHSRACWSEYRQAANPTFCKYTISAQQFLQLRVFPTWRTSPDGNNYIGQFEKSRTEANAITFVNLAKKPHLFKAVEFNPNYDSFASAQKPIIVFYCTNCRVHVVKDGNHRLLSCAYHGCDPTLEVYQVSSRDWSKATVDMKNYCSCAGPLNEAT